MTPNAPKISVVVPCYNVEAYLRKCVESLTQQTLTDIEIILVNDGSPDACGQICDEYAAKDERIKVVHKVNGGLSSARNAGMELCTGEYIGFVDGDDFVAPDMYEHLYSAAQANNADIAFCQKILVTTNGTFIDHIGSDAVGCVLYEDPEAYLLELFVGKRTGIEVWNKIYKRDVVGDLRFIDGYTGEDILFSVEVVVEAKRFVYVNEALYYYVQRPGSTMSSFSIKHNYDGVIAWQKNLELVKTKYPRLIVACEYNVYVIMRMCMDRYLFLSTSGDYPQQVGALQAWMRKDLPKIFRNPYFSLRQKLVFVVRAYSVALYRWLKSKKQKGLGRRLPVNSL